MAIYICDDCGQWKDNDWDCCHEHPKDPCALLCEDCAAEREEHPEDFEDENK